MNNTSVTSKGEQAKNQLLGKKVITHAETQAKLKAEAKTAKEKAAKEAAQKEKAKGESK